MCKTLTQEGKLETEKTWLNFKNPNMPGEDRVRFSFFFSFIYTYRVCF